MPVGEVTPRNSFFLQTFGVPALLPLENGVPGQPLALRRKDLALLIFLCVEGKRTYPRGLLASMLWGDASEERARHSLTQTLARLRQILGADSFELSSDSVGWRNALRSDFRELTEVTQGGVARWPKAAFLADFIVGHGGAEFEIWAEEKRTYYRMLVLGHLERLGREAEERGSWEEALALGQRSIEVDPVNEEAHRRVMRAWAAMGERGLALQHFRSLERWLRSEFDSEPEADTSTLAAELTAPAAETSESLSAGSRWRISPRRGQQPPWPSARPLGSEMAPDDGQRTAFPLSAFGRYRLALLVVVILLAATALGPWHWLDADEVVVVPGDGQPVLVQGETRPRMMYDGTLFRFPDWETFMACSGWQPGLIKIVPQLPDSRPAPVLPTVLDDYALAGHTLVRSDRSDQLYVVVGCVKSPVPDPTRAGFSGAGPVHVVADSVLDRLPDGPSLVTPLRRAGTVLRERGGKRMLWVLFAGGALEVPSVRVLASHCRGRVVDVEAEEMAAYRVIGAVKHAQSQCGYVPEQAGWRGNTPPAVSRPEPRNTKD